DGLSSWWRHRDRAGLRHSRSWPARPRRHCRAQLSAPASHDSRRHYGFCARQFSRRSSLRCDRPACEAIGMRPRSLLIVALSLVSGAVAAAILAPEITPYDPLSQDIATRLKGPSAAHWLGTDQLGRDVLSRILFGLRASLAVSAAAVVSALATGGAVGLAPAYYRGWTERIAMRLMDSPVAFPLLLRGLRTRA